MQGPSENHISDVGSLIKYLYRMDTLYGTRLTFSLYIVISRERAFTV